MQAARLLHAGSVRLLLKLSVVHSVTDPSKLQGDPSADGPYNLFVLRASSSPSPSHGSWNFFQASYYCPPSSARHPLPRATASSSSDARLEENSERRPATPSMTPTTPPSAACQASPGGPHCPPSRSAAAPARASRRASRRGRSSSRARSSATARASPVPDSGSAAHPAGLFSGRCRYRVAARDAGIGPRGRLSPPAPPPASAATSVPPPSARGAEPRPGPDGSDVTASSPRAGPREPRPPRGEGRRARAAEPGRAGPRGPVGGLVSWLRAAGTGRGSREGRGGAGRDRRSAARGQGGPRPLRAGRRAVCGRPAGRIPAGTFKHTAGGALGRGARGPGSPERRSGGRGPPGDAEEEVTA